MNTPADQFDMLVKAGAERFVATFETVFAYMAQGGRTPGITVPSKAELLKIYESTTEQYWKTLHQADPAEAQSQLEQFTQVSK